MVHQASAHSEAKIRTRRRTIIYQCSLKLIFLFSIPSSNNKNSFNDLKAGNAPYCTKHSVCASLFLRKWLAAEKLGWEKEKKHFELKRSNNYYWHNKHLYTYMDVTPQRQERKKKEHAFQTNITAIWAKIWSKRVHPFRRKEKKNGPKDTLPFATVVVNVRAKSSKERGVQLLF